MFTISDYFCLSDVLIHCKYGWKEEKRQIYIFDSALSKHKCTENLIEAFLFMRLYPRSKLKAVRNAQGK